VLEVRSKVRFERQTNVSEGSDDGWLGGAVENRASESSEEGLQNVLSVSTESLADGACEIASETDGSGEDLELVQNCEGRVDVLHEMGKIFVESRTGG
jgi:hypothetical protein